MDESPPVTPVVTNKDRKLGPLAKGSSANASEGHKQPPPAHHKEGGSDEDNRSASDSEKQARGRRDGSYSPPFHGHHTVNEGDERHSHLYERIHQLENIVSTITKPKRAHRRKERPPSGDSEDEERHGKAGSRSASKKKKNKRKRRQDPFKDYSATDSSDEDCAWELEEAHERSERYEAMRIATIAPSTSAKSKAVREAQKAFFKPIKAIEEQIEILKQLSFDDKRGVIRRGREARKAMQDRWDEVTIAEEHGFAVVEKYKQQQATGKAKSLAAAIEKVAGSKRSNSAPSKRQARYSSPRRSPSPSRGRSPDRNHSRAPNRSASSFSYGYGNRYSGHGGGFGGSNGGGGGGYHGYQQGAGGAANRGGGNRGNSGTASVPLSPNAASIAAAARPSRPQQPMQQLATALSAMRAPHSDPAPNASAQSPTSHSYPDELPAEPTAKGQRVCGNIHKLEFRAFWLAITRDDPYVRQIIEDGYKLQFDTEPEEYKERNNASAERNMPFVRESLKEMLEAGVVKQVDSAHCVSPLTVAERTNPDGTKKLRLCWDGSRMVNKCIKKEHVKFVDLDKSAAMVNEGDYMFVYDLSKCFYHVKLHPDSRKYVAFKVDDQIYQYQVICFGLAPATAAITRVTKPICAAINKKGIRHSIYIDDGRGGAQTKEEANKARLFVYDIMQKAGFVLADEKSDGAEDISQNKKYLGMIINSADMTITVPQDKLDEVKALIRGSLGRTQSAKDKAKVTGKVVALEPGMGKVVHLLTKSAQADIAAVTGSHPWGWKMLWSRQAEEELQMLADSLDEFNGAPIKARHEEKRLVEKIELADRVAVSDASATGTCAYSLKGDFSFFLHGQLADHELGASSGERELCAVQKGLGILRKRGLNQNKKKFEQLLWVTDSTNMVAFLTKGSMKRHIQARIFEVYKLAHSMKMIISPVHLRRDDPMIQLADAGSREKDLDSWEIDEHTFSEIERRLGPTDIDLFADTYNKKKKFFSSLFDFGGPIAVDAFSLHWNRESLGRIYACPPINKIIQTIKKIEKSEEQAAGLLLVPAWPTAQFWPYVYPNGALNKRFSTAIPVRPSIKTREWARPYMAGKKDFIAIKFE